MFDKRIVTIHAVSENAFSPSRLVRYIKTMRCLGYSFVSINEVLNSSSKYKEIALTFDDAYKSCIENAIPLLRKFQVPATMFIPTGLLGLPANHQKLMKHECYKNEATMSLEDVDLWLEKGFRIGFHTHEHIDLYESREDEIENDFRKGMEVFYRHGWEANYFAYPKGHLPQDRASFEALLKKYGIKSAFTINHGSVDKDNPYYINRVCLGNKEPFIWSILKSLGIFGDYYYRKRIQRKQQKI